MKMKNLVTNTTVGCCLSVTSAFASGYDSSTDKSALLFNYIQVANTKYISNNSLADTKISNIIDFHKLESDTLIQFINSKLDLDIDNYFLPNTSSEDKVTLFITCAKFRAYCEKEQYIEAVELENQINSIVLDSLSNTKKIGRIAFL